MRGPATQAAVARWQQGDRVWVSGDRQPLRPARAARVSWEHVVGAFRLRRPRRPSRGATAGGGVEPRPRSHRTRLVVDAVGRRGAGPRSGHRRRPRRAAGDDRPLPAQRPVAPDRRVGPERRRSCWRRPVRCCAARDRRRGWAATLALIGWFVVLTRAEPSVLRAGAMAALSADGVRPRPRARAAAAARRGRDRPAAGRSAARLVGRLLAVGRRDGRRDGRRPAARAAARPLGPLAVPLGVTLGAQVGVGAAEPARVRPAAARRHRSANLLAVPVAGFVMLYGLPAALRRRRRAAGARPCVMLPVGVGVRWVDAVAAVAAAVEPPPPWAWLGVGRRVALVVVRGACRPVRARPMGCQDDRRDGRAPPDRRRRVDPARRGRRRSSHELVGDGDRSLMVDEFDGRRLRAARRRRRRADAAVPHRAGGSSSPATSGGSAPTSWRPLVGYLGDPLDSTELVLVGGGGRLRQGARRRRRRRAAPSRRPTPPSRPRDRQAWVDEHGAARGLRLDAPAPPARSPSASARTSAGSTASCHAAPPRTATRHAAAATTSSRSSARPAACRRGTSPTRSTPGDTDHGADAARPDDRRRASATRCR